MENFTMDNSNEKLIHLIKNDSTIDYIKQEMQLTNSQLLYRLYLLKYKGYAIQQKYFGNGDITVSLANKCDYIDNYARIYTKYKELSMRALVISDLHCFHEDENRRAIDTAFNYCIKNGIHIVFICGDLIDCMENNEVSLDKQAETFTELYPYDNSIIHFCVLGNHDLMSIKKSSIDLKKIIENKRLDIVPVDYLEAGIQIKNDKLFLAHPINNMQSFYEVKRAHCLNFIGHSHTTKIVESSVYVPSLSNVKVANIKNFGFIPQALDVTLQFNSKNGTFKNVIIDQVVMEKNPYIIGEHTINLNHPQPDKNDLEVYEYPSLKRTV